MSQEPLKPFYADLLESMVERVVDKRPIPTWVGGGKGSVEQVLAPDGQSFYQFRKTQLSGALYDLLVEDWIQEHLEDIFETVQDPSLFQARSVLDRNGGLEGCSRESFQEAYSSEANFMHLISHLRPIVLLTLLKDNPSLIPRLDGNSTYFPHRLHETKILSKREVVEDILSAVPGIIGSDLGSRIEQIDQYVVPGQTHFKSRNSGKYVLPDSSRIKWADPDDPSTEQGIDELFNSVKVKKDLYETFFQLVRISSQIAKAGGRETRDLKHTELGMGRGEYHNMREALTHYGVNQLGWQWNEGEGEFREVNPTMVTRINNIDFISAQNSLIVNYQKFVRNGFFDFKHTFKDTPDSHYLDSTSQLALAAVVINRYHAAAKKRISE